MRESEFGGAEKVGEWWTARWERELVQRNVRRVPVWLETHHLTLLTLAWSAVTLVSGFLAGSHHPAWLWGIHVAVAGQYLSDLFDGAVGRQRETGLVRWGFFMDHLLDFVFLAAFWLAYLFLLPATALPWLALVVALSGALMAESFLGFGATGEFRISHFGVGPTETRIALLGLNTAVIGFGPGWLAGALPWVALGAGIALALVGFRTQRALWRADMAAKNAAESEPSGIL